MKICPRVLDRQFRTATISPAFWSMGGIAKSATKLKDCNYVKVRFQLYARSLCISYRNTETVILKFTLQVMFFREHRLHHLNTLAVVGKSCLLLYVFSLQLFPVQT